MFQSATNWADGGAFVNQCPISTGNSFSYEFTANDQAGTFWYHSHLSTQYCDGLRGPMVIYDSEDPHLDLYDVDDGECFPSPPIKASTDYIPSQSPLSSPSWTGTTPLRLWAPSSRK